MTQPLTRYVIHRGDSYVRLARHEGRTLAVMVRDSCEASRFPYMTEALLAAFQSEIGVCRDWAIEAVRGQA